MRQDVDRDGCRAYIHTQTERRLRKSLGGNSGDEEANEAISLHCLMHRRVLCGVTSGMPFVTFQVTIDGDGNIEIDQRL
jgi:hypothetical protein